MFSNNSFGIALFLFFLQEWRQRLVGGGLGGVYLILAVRFPHCCSFARVLPVSCVCPPVANHGQYLQRCRVRIPCMPVLCSAGLLLIEMFCACECLCMLLCTLCIAPCSLLVGIYCIATGLPVVCLAIIFRGTNSYFL